MVWAVDADAADHCVFLAAASLDEIVSCDHSVEGIVILAGLRYDDSEAGEKMQELLDIYDENWQCIGTALRDEVHERGLLHRVVHCWIIQESHPVFWFQQRAHMKKDFPDCFDLPCGGHVDTGETPIQAILRELQEEIGLHVTENDLISLGAYRAPDFHIPGYYDREMSHVFMLCADAPAFSLGDEVQRMVRVSADNFYQMEVNERKMIPVQTENGRHILVDRNQWCCHDGEFKAMVLPYLKQKNPEIFSVED